jgi:hypothetical protein
LQQTTAEAYATRTSRAKPVCALCHALNEVPPLEELGKHALGRTLSVLREREGLQLSQVPRSFAFDVLLAYSCREHGVVLVTRNARDMQRIRRVFTFAHVAPYPEAA